MAIANTFDHAPGDEDKSPCKLSRVQLQTMSSEHGTLAQAKTESFHSAGRNLSHERLKPFTPTPQTFRSTAPNPFT